MKNFKFYKLLVFMLALFILPALLGCGKIPKTYVMKETQKEMSTQLARIYQAKVKSEAISHLMGRGTTWSQRPFCRRPGEIKSCL